MAIPKKLHIIWIGDESKRPDALIQTWREMNPSFSLKVWGNEDLEKATWDFMPQIRAWWNREINGAADVMRWELLYRHGGLALDADSICVRPLEDWLFEPDGFAVWENEITRPGLIGCNALGFAPRHPLVGQILADISRDPDLTAEMAWVKVGPGRITNTVRSLKYNDLTIYPSHFFAPEHFSGPQYRGKGPVFASQKWGSTYKSYGKLGKGQGEERGSFSQLMERGQAREALEAVEKEMALGETAELWNRWSIAQAGCGNVTRAEQGYRRALVLDHANRDAAVQLGLMLIEQCRLEEGVPLLEQHRASLTQSEKQTLAKLLQPLTNPLPKNVQAAKSDQPPTVSVVTPCYKQADFLPDVVASVVAQTFTDWEMIIVNDGSPDNTSEVANKLIQSYPEHRIRLVEKANGGLSDARNAGIRAAKGRYILPLDADDKIRPQMLEKTVAVLNSDPTVSIVYTDVEQFGARQGIYPTPEYDFAKLCEGNQLSCCSLYRRKAWEDAGGYNTNMVWGYEDWDFWISCGEKGHFGRHLPQPLFLYRLKETSMLVTALDHDSELKAQIVRNHPSQYNDDTRAWAELTLSVSELVRKGDPQSAIVLLKAALQKYETSELWNDLATVYCACGDLKKAEEGYRHALRLDPKHRQSGVNFGLFLLARGRRAEGMALIDQFKARLTYQENQAVQQLIAPEASSGSDSLPQRNQPACRPLPKVSSFDLFDTLVARRCVEPKAVFDALEAQSGISGLAKLRIQAEAMVANRSYGLDDIYERLRGLLGISQQEADALRSLELKIEKDNLFPIREMTTKVSDGDVIVSDMYLPKDFLRSVVADVAGLPRNPLLVTSDGKATGKIWKSLKTECEVVAHTGDNPQTDVRSAQQHGIPVIYTRVAAFSPEEKELADNFPGLARAMREGRLSTFHTDQNLRGLQLVQSQTNFPMLYLASLALHRQLVNEGRRRVLMSSRDAFLWHRLLESLRSKTNASYAVTYFLTSRLTRAFPSAAYLRYAGELLQEPSIIVDLCGTGWSLRRLLERVPAPATPIFLLCKYEDAELEGTYQSIGKTAMAGDIRFLLTTSQGDVIESPNFARHPMLADMREVSGEFVPVFLNAANVAWRDIPEIAIQHDAFFATLAAMEKTDLAKDLEADEATIVPALKKVQERLSGCSGMFRFADAFKSKEEANTMELLRKLAEESQTVVGGTSVKAAAASD